MIYIIKLLKSTTGKMLVTLYYWCKFLYYNPDIRRKNMQ